MEKRLPSLFRTIAVQQRPIQVVTSGVTRAVDSANAFTGGLDLFTQAQAVADGTSKNGAVLRFTHAEEVEPLAVVLGLPGSTKGAASLYTYANNPWRGASVAPMAANIQWDLYAGPGHYLVRMLYNEKETAFKSSCHPISKGSAFYDLRELERCYAQPLG
jgi:hypothetical protein